MKRIREAQVDKFILRLIEQNGCFTGVVIGDGKIKAKIDGENADKVWQLLHDEASKLSPKYVGFNGARNRFLYWFKGGFKSPDYLASERDYKVDAKSRLDANASLADAAAAAGFGEAVLSVFRATNLLSPFEKTRLQDVLRGKNADSFIQAAAEFTIKPSRLSLFEIERLLRPYDSAKWTVATYLPFLWKPEEHMFLKPEATNDFAERVGHRFALDYAPNLDFGIYESLLDLVSRTTEELSDLEPRDRIDIQSFIWVVGGYEEGRDEPKP